MNYFPKRKLTQFSLIALSLAGTIGIFPCLDVTVNPVLAQNNVSNPEAKKAEAERLFNEGMQLFQQGTAESYQQAIAKWEAALPLWREAGDKSKEALTLVGIGFVYSNLGEKQQALDYYQQALPLRKAVGDRAGEAVTLDNLGYLLASQNQPQLAIVFYKQSVNLYESLRGEIKGLSQEIQQSYTKTVEDTYRRLADVLLSQDRILEAQRVLDLLKVQELDDYLRGVRGTGQQLSFFRPEEEILKKYNELQKSAIQLGEELSSLRKIPESNRNSAQNQRIDQLVQLQKALNRQFNDFTDSPEIVALVEQLSRTAKKQSIDLADLDALRENLQQLNAALLYPLILDDRLELVITTPNSPPLRRTVPVKKEELNQVILQFRQALQNPGSDAKTPAQKLYNWLIAPLEADLKAAQVKTIIYAPDGQLRYIPLAALYDGQQWLVQRYGINNITAKSFTELNAQPKNQPKVLAGAFANASITYTVTISQRQVNFRGLPFAGKEVETLATTLTQTTKLVDKDFSLASIEPKMNEYSILHFATHAAFVPGAPEDSFILFGNGDKPNLKDIEDWTLNKVDLVVLSACETGVGGEFGNGAEILGLGYQFQSRGAKAVVASLWQVSDGGTQVLMDAFYGALKGGNYSKTEALRQAQIALITGDFTAVAGERGGIEVVITGLPQNVSKGLSHPYYIMSA
jgi:CHAT domain-containing protein